MVAEIDTLGGTLKRARAAAAQGFERSDQELRAARRRSTTTKRKAGSTGDGGPNHRTLWRVQPGERALARRRDMLEVRLAAPARTASRSQRSIPSAATAMSSMSRSRCATRAARRLHVRLLPAHARRQAGRPTERGRGDVRRAELHRLRACTPTSTSSRRCILPTSTRARPTIVKQATDGWLAFVQHYFVSAWLPPAASAARLRDREAARRHLRRPAAVPLPASRPAPPRRSIGAALRGAAGAAAPRAGRARARPGRRLRLARDHRLAALLAAGAVPRPDRQLGRRDHPADRHSSS